ncbi:SEFIR domain-containing protein [Micromonospora sp. NPDC049049]|uniref:SEFIR domain-containing protein n=1 Tax=Micromonospora sp. NPDC049049 TaxID=3155495 RepID=UPI0033DC01E8
MSAMTHRVFIVWAHRDQRWSAQQQARYQAAVLAFARTLDRVEGIEVEFDLFHSEDRTVDFTRWGPDQISWADTVLMISSAPLWDRWSGRNPANEGAGAVRECDALHGLFDTDQDAFQRKVLIVVLPGGMDAPVPADLSRIQRRIVDDPQATLVLRWLLNKPRYPRGTVKTRVDLPPFPEASFPGMPSRRADHLAAERARRKQPSPVPDCQWSPSGSAKSAEVPIRPITAGMLAATVVPLASGAADEAGKQAWASLSAFVRDRFGRESELGAAVQALADQPHSPTVGEVLGRILEDAAASDDHTAAWLRSWLEQAGPLAG